MRPYGCRMHVVRRISRLVAVSVLGSLLVAAGVVMLLTPGPGLLAVAAGLAVWAREFGWARHLLERTRERIAARLGRHDDDPVTTMPAAPSGGDGGDAPSQRRVA